MPKQYDAEHPKAPLYKKIVREGQRQIVSVFKVDLEIRTFAEINENAVLLLFERLYNVFLVQAKQQLRVKSLRHTLLQYSSLD